MGCDIGKGVTRMLTPSERQIQALQAATPVLQSLIQADVAKSQIATGGVAAGGYTGAPTYGQYGGYAGTGYAQPKTSADDVVMIVAGVALVGGALWFLLKK